MNTKVIIIGSAGAGNTSLVKSLSGKNESIVDSNIQLGTKELIIEKLCWKKSENEV